MEAVSRRRAEVLRGLIDYRLPIEPVLAELAAFEWDSAKDLAILESADILRTLHRYVSGALTAEQVVDWADLVECREDIGFPNGQKDELSHVIFRLANPNINGPVTLEVARQIQLDLGGETHGI